jgi:hypothetical protein
MTQRLTGKIAVISGGASGMGVSHTRRMIQEGAKVISFDRNEGAGPQLVDEYGEDKLLFLDGDVRNAKDWDMVVAAGRRRFGTPNVLVNNAGISPLQTLEKVSEDDYRRVIDINQVGTFLGMRALVPALRESGGSIINIASTAALVAFMDLFPYVASKWAVRGIGPLWHTGQRNMPRRYRYANDPSDCPHAIRGPSTCSRFALQKVGATGRDKCRSPIPRLGRIVLHERQRVSHRRCLHRAVATAIDRSDTQNGSS